MDSAIVTSDNRKMAAFALPMALFLFLLALGGLFRKFGGAFWFDSPEYWLYPAQTILCGALLFWFWPDYSFRKPTRIVFTALVGILVFALWISPQVFFARAPRLIGFNPDVFSNSTAYWGTVVLRFVRLVVVVPLVEEIFWRGFLLRYFINEKFDTVPVGTFSWFPFTLVTLGFGFGHSPADWIAACITGALYNLVAYRTKNLASCVAAHALTNLLLGLWIMKTHQWGFW